MFSIWNGGKWKCFDKHEIKFPSETKWRPELRMLMQFPTRPGSIFNHVSITLNTRAQKMAVKEHEWYRFTNRISFFAALCVISLIFHFIFIKYSRGQANTLRYIPKYSEKHLMVYLLSRRKQDIKQNFSNKKASNFDERQTNCEGRLNCID